MWYADGAQSESRANFIAFKYPGNSLFEEAKKTNVPHILHVLVIEIANSDVWRLFYSIAASLFKEFLITSYTVAPEILGRILLVSSNRTAE